MKKFIVALLFALMLVPVGFIFVGCNGNNEDHTYNLIMCKATNPAQIAVADATSNGHSSYVWLERVSTYTQLNQGNYDNFVKANSWGNNTTKENILTQDVINDFRDRIVNIKAKDADAKFNIYVRDMDVLYAYQMVIEAELEENDYNIILGEDGSALYVAWSNRYVTGRKTSAESDEPYKQLLSDVESLDAVLKSIKEGTYNPNLSGDVNYEYVFAAATKSNVAIYLYIMDDIRTRTNENSEIANSKIYESAGLKELTEGTLKINFVEKTLESMYNGMSANSKNVYRALVFGETESNKVDELFNRSSKKTLVIAGTAINSMAALDLVEDIVSVDQIPDEAKLIAGFNEIETNQDKLTAYNQFLEYKYVFEAIYKQYSGEYDILYKDHPRCGPEEGKETNWTTRYGIKGKWQYYLIRDFFTNNSVGKNIGILPSGIGIDNFLVFGFEFKVAGWDSSFYKTFPKNSTLFLITTKPYENYSNFTVTGSYLLPGEKHENVETWNSYKIRQISDGNKYNYYYVDRLGNVSIKVNYTIDGGKTFKSLFVACGTNLSSIDTLKDYNWLDASGAEVTATPSQSAMFKSALVIYGTAK